MNTPPPSASGSASAAPRTRTSTIRSTATGGTTWNGARARPTTILKGTSVPAPHLAQDLRFIGNGLAAARSGALSPVVGALRAAPARRRHAARHLERSVLRRGPKHARQQLPGHQRGAVRLAGDCPPASKASSRSACGPNSAPPITPTVPTRRFRRRRTSCSAAICRGCGSRARRASTTRRWRAATRPAASTSARTSIRRNGSSAPRRCGISNWACARARWTASWICNTDVYAMRRSSMQVYNSRQLLPDNPLTYVFYTDNAAHGDNIGLEAELHWRPQPRWLLAATAALQDTRYLGYVNDGLDLRGREQAFAPPWQLSVSAGVRASERRVCARRSAGPGWLLLQLQPRPARARAHAGQSARRLARSQLDCEPVGAQPLRRRLLRAGILFWRRASRFSGQAVPAERRSAAGGGDGDHEPGRDLGCGIEHTAGAWAGGDRGRCRTDLCRVDPAPQSLGLGGRAP